MAANYQEIPTITGPQTHEVGPGLAFENLSDVPWTDLHPGDTIRLHWRSTPYAEKIQIPARGTAEEPIRFIGVRGPNGQRPVISGANAITGPNTDFASWDSTQFLGLVTISRGHSDPSTFKPSFIEISGLEIRDVAQTQGIWYEGAAGIRLIGAESVTIRDCKIHHTCSGIVGRMGYGGEFGVNRDILIERCHFHDIGTAGQYGNANIRTSAAGLTIRFCRLDAPVAGSYGDNVFDRSAGTVIEACRIEGAGRMLVLVEPIGSGAEILRNDPRFQTTRLAGNLIFVTNPYASHPIFVGADSSGVDQARSGTFEMHHNTVLISNGVYKVNVPTVFSNLSVDFRNNIVWAQGNEILQIMGGAGTLNSGPNWLSPNWQISSSANYTGTDAILPVAINDPLLDEHHVPLPESPCRDAAVNPLVDIQYHETASGLTRSTVCSGADLGAFEGGGAAPSLNPFLTGKALGNVFAIWLNGNPSTSYTVEFSDDLSNWQLLGIGTTDETGALLMEDPNHPGSTERFYRAQ